MTANSGLSRFSWEDRPALARPPCRFPSRGGLKGKGKGFSLLPAPQVEEVAELTCSPYSTSCFGSPSPLLAARTPAVLTRFCQCCQSRLTASSAGSAGPSAPTPRPSSCPRFCFPSKRVEVNPQACREAALGNCRPRSPHARCDGDRPPVPHGLRRRTLARLGLGRGGRDRKRATQNRIPSPGTAETRTSWPPRELPRG